MSILFLLASLGAINGFILGLYLIAKRKHTIADMYFGGLILALSIRIGKSILFYFQRDTDLLILQIGLSACIFIGPFFYLFLRALREKQTKSKVLDRRLLLSLLVIILAVGIIWPYRTRPEIWITYIVKGIYVIWGIFILLGLYEARHIFRKFFSQPIKLDKREQYILGIVISTIFVTLTYQFALFIEGVTYIWGSIIFSFSFYYLAGRALLSQKSITPKINDAPPLQNGNELFRNLEFYMAEQKPFTNPKLKLDELADAVNMSRHELSRLLNEVYPSGFSHYIKSHRVKETQKLIQSRDELSLEGIGFEAGFNSKSAFFEAFKQITGQTPSNYKKSLKTTH